MRTTRVMPRSIGVADGHFVVAFPYDAEIVAAMKALPSRRFRPDDKTWLVPTSDRLLLDKALQSHGFEWSDDARRNVDHLESRVARIGGPRITIKFPYHPDAVAAVREIEGRRWDAEGRCWTAPLTSIRAVRAFAAQFGLHAPDLSDVPDADPVIEPTISLMGGAFIVRFPYDRDLIQSVRDLPTATYDSWERGWRVSAAAALEVAEFAHAWNARTDEDTSIAFADVERDAERIVASRAVDADIDIPPLGGVLMPFQRAGVAYALSSLRLASGRRTGGVLIADEQGLGKTVQALAVMRVVNPARAVVICPSSVRLNWQREIRKWLPTHPPTMLYGTTADSEVMGALNIVGWEVLADWQPQFGSVDFVVFDEMHYAKNVASNRTVAAMKLADGVLARDGVVIGLTGTPMLNRPLEILPLIRILGRVKDLGGGVHLRELALENPHLLNRALRAKCFVRRRKADVLTELPPKRWVSVPLQMDSALADVYEAAEADIVRYVAEEARKAAEQAGATDEAARAQAVAAAFRAMTAAAIVAINKLRVLAARAKMQAVHDWVDDFTHTGSKVVIFAWHQDIVQDLADRHADGLKIVGGMTDAAKQAVVDEFQTNPDVRVVVCSIKAAGVGLTLTAASDVVFVEQGWNPAEMEQAADRCHRIGQTDSVTAWNLLAANTIDEAIYGLIDAKRKVIDAATEGDAGADADHDHVVTALLAHLASLR